MANDIQLKDFPIKFDNTALNFFPEWSRNLSKILNKQQSEGGYDLIQIIRVKKLSVPLSCSVADDYWVNFFEQYYEKDSFTLSIYSPRSHSYENHTVSMENISITPRKKSEDLTEVTGVWDVSFTLEEL